MKPIAIKPLMALALLLLCTACNKGPNSEQIKTAMDLELKQTQATLQNDPAFAQLQQLGIKSLTMTINQVDKKKCTVLGNQKHYRCQIILDATMPNGLRNTTETTIVVQKQGNNYVVDRNTEEQ